MKNKKIVIFICVVLILIVFAQIIYFNTVKVKKDNNQNETIQDDSKKSEGIISNIDDFYNKYPEIAISKEYLEEKIYTLITKDFGYIVSNTRNNTPNDSLEFYKKNMNEINSMGFYNSNDFILIAEDLNNSSRIENNSVKKIEINVNNDFLNNTSNYVFDLDITYSNNAVVQLRGSIPIKYGAKNSNADNEEYKRIQYSSNSQLSKLIAMYKNDLQIQNVVNYIRNITNNIEQIHNNTLRKSLNQQKQYYKDNESFFNSLGIINEEDFIKVAVEINNSNDWQADNELEYYKLDYSTSQNNEDYIKFNIIYNYFYGEEINLAINIAKRENIVPYIRITGENGDLQ